MPSISNALHFDKDESPKLGHATDKYVSVAIGDWFMFFRDSNHLWKFSAELLDIAVDLKYPECKREEAKEEVVRDLVVSNFASNLTGV